MDTNGVQEGLARLAQETVSQVEAARILGWGLPRVRAAVRDGRIASVRMPAAVLVPVAEVERMRGEGR